MPSGFLAPTPSFYTRPFFFCWHFLGIYYCSLLAFLSAPFLLPCCRSQQIEENCFVGFSIQQFLEGKKGKMDQFVSELENCETGDERYAVVEDYLGAFHVTLAKDPLWTR